MSNIVTVTKYSPFRFNERSCSQRHQIKILKMNLKYTIPPSSSIYIKTARIPLLSVWN